MAPPTAAGAGPTIGRKFPLLDDVVPAGEPVFDLVDGVAYRYNLPRAARDRADGPRAVFVCMNPSSADEWHDDWTNRQIARRASKMTWCGSQLSGWNTVNLCAAIATRPRDLVQLAASGKDVVGRHNHDEIKRAVRDADFVVVAWGNGGRRWSDPTISTLRRSRKPICHWGELTATLSQPRHPSRLARDVPLNRIAF
jgi:hypothetical protein